MDVDARRSEDHFEPVMMPEQALSDLNVQPPDPWSSWAKALDRPAPEPVAVDAAPEAEPDPPAEDGDDLATLGQAVAQLAAELADERQLRTRADEARREAEAAVHAWEMETARLSAEMAAQRTRISELERDRDEVIHRAEELLTAVRERADQRLAAVELERAAMARRVEDAWLAAAVLRSARPLRLRGSEASVPAEAEQEVLEALDEYEIDPAFAAEAPKLAGEIEQLRQRLRSQVHKPADIDAVEDGVEDLRVLRLARETEPRGRRRK